MTTILGTERLSNLGYCAVSPQVDGNTPITPTTYIPIYKETLTTDLGIDFDNPIVGIREKVYNAFMGHRSHDGVITALAEPNTIQHWFAMMLKKQVITGGGPYTHPYTVDDPQTFYTVDLLKGQVIYRTFGVQAESIKPTYDKNKMQVDSDVTGKGSFIVRTIASTDTTHLVLDTKYDPNPTFGLVVNDLIRIYKADASALLDLTVSAVNVDGVTLTVTGGNPSTYGAGDLVFLRPQSTPPTETIVDPFLFTRTEFHFDTTAANALAQTSAQQLNVEKGSAWKLMYSFENKKGAQRSGSFDPVSLPRLQAEAQLTIKEFLDQPFDKARFLNLQDRACVIRAYSGSGYELRITLNALKQKTSKDPLETGKILYNDIEYEARRNITDGQAYSVAVINNIST